VQSVLLSAAILIAEADGGAAGGGGAGGGAAGLLSSPMLPILVVMLLFMWFFVFRPQRQEQSRRQAMISALKKNDRVITASGIYGVVTNVRKEADEVTLKVDEATNTKIRVTLGAIAQVLGDEPSEDTPSK
jgi:preprotein translocase subunit YajC